MNTLERAFAPEATRRETPLTQIEYLANRAETSAQIIDAFLDRFHGRPQCASGSQVQAVPAGHSGQIERLAEALGHIENLVDQLSNIG